MLSTPLESSAQSGNKFNSSLMTDYLYVVVAVFGGVTALGPLLALPDTQARASMSFKNLTSTHLSRQVYAQVLAGTDGRRTKIPMLHQTSGDNFVEHRCKRHRSALRRYGTMNTIGNAHRVIVRATDLIQTYISDYSSTSPSHQQASFTLSTRLLSTYTSFVTLHF